MGVQYPSGKFVAKSYDALDRLTGISYAGKKLADYRFAPLTLDASALGNGTGTKYVYDPFLRISSISHSGPSGKKGAAGTSVRSMSLSYDNLGNIMSNGDENFSYDPLSRLTKASYPAQQDGKSRTEEWLYDPMGNRAAYLESLTKDAGKKAKSESSNTNYETNGLNQYGAIGGAKLSYDGN